MFSRSVRRTPAKRGRMNAVHDPCRDRCDLDSLLHQPAPQRRRRPLRRGIAAPLPGNNRSSRRHTGEVIAGNTGSRRRSNSAWPVPVVWFDGSDLDATAYAIADNRTAEFADWNEGALANLLRSFARRTRSRRRLRRRTTSMLLEATARAAVDRGLLDDGPGIASESRSPKRGDLGCSATTASFAVTRPSSSTTQRVMEQRQGGSRRHRPALPRRLHRRAAQRLGQDWTASYREIDIDDADGFFPTQSSSTCSTARAEGRDLLLARSQAGRRHQRIWRDLGILDHQQIIWVKPTPVFGRVY